MYKGASLMIFVIIVAIVLICYYLPIIPFTITHFYKICYNGVIDLYYYFKHKERNLSLIHI